jgi:hypothetical protein
VSELGEALVAAGWFREARGVALQLAAFDLDGALALDARSLAGLDFLESIRRAMRRTDRASTARSTASQRSGDDSVIVDLRGQSGTITLGGIETRITSLDALLESLAPLFARTNVFLGGERDAALIQREIDRSPRMSYAGLAELVHPGPTFSADDERDGLGKSGEPVPGLAPLLLRMGRFGLFGELTGGGGPDATLLPVLHIERRSGKHLGAEWHGTIAWCENADLKSRAGRRGAKISAAALHEGYWVDVDSVRGELAAWQALRKRFGGDDGAERVDRVLATRGLSVGDADDRRQRLRTGALLGESQRVRLPCCANARSRRTAARRSRRWASTSSCASRRTTRKDTCAIAGGSCRSGVTRRRSWDSCSRPDSRRRTCRSSWSTARN